MDNRTRRPPDPDFQNAFRECLPPAAGAIRFADYMHLALYHPSVGYYMKDRRRVGYRSDADFYTASSLGPVFSKLVFSALHRLCPIPLEECSFVELGPESQKGILSCIEDPPFARTLPVRVGQSFAVPSPGILFSNEVFDAQPFRRFIRKKDAWRELGVRLSDGRLDWCSLENSSIPAALPAVAPENYIVDWPEGACKLMEQIVSMDWTGVFVAFDYGMPLATLLEDRPGGTARSYAGHRQGSDLLDHPGHLDLTCHVAWDLLEDSLRENGFSEIRLEYQESFFMHHAEAAIRGIVESSESGLSREKQTLMELLHPGNMGRKFQVLHAKRGLC